MKAVVPAKSSAAPRRRRAKRKAHSKPRWLQIAEEQGVKPVKDIKDLVGDFWPEDESIDDFIAAVREWRREGTSPRP